MSNFEIMKKVWAEAMQEVTQQNPWMARLQKGDVQLCHYKGFLLETYLNTGLNPQLQAFSTMYFKGNPRSIIRKYFQHAISEIGHDLMAKSDLMNLGVPEEVILQAKPQPETEAILGYFTYLVQFRSPLCYLGYLFHLEFSPTTNGMKYIEMLKQKGIPENALTFLHEHATVDIQHNKLMESYVSQLLNTPEELQLVVDAIRAAVKLHSHVLASAFENGEKLFGAKASAA